MNSGVYCLILFLPFSKKIKIGKLGIFNFQKGYYGYIGSALNNLEKRINRHKSPNKDKKLHWHIDYFLEHTKIIGVKTIQTNKKLECILSKKISSFGEIIIKKFGSSDCNCNAHLYFFKTNPIKLKGFGKLFPN